MNSAWHQLYSAVFGKRLDGDELEAFEDIIERGVKNLRTGEVSRAITSLGDEHRKSPRKYPPTANDIITRIIKLKYEDKLEDPRFNRDHHILVHRFSEEAGRDELHREIETAHEWQRELKRAAGDPARVGDVICRPALIEHCKEREDYAKRMGIEYKFGGQNS